MYSAIVLINVERKQVKQAADELSRLTGVKEVYSVAGEYDLVLTVSVDNKPDFAELVTDKIVHNELVHHTKTLFAMDQYK